MLVENCIKAGCPETGVVLDPFCGTGTSLLTARKLGRRYVGIDVSAEYCAITRKNLDLDVIMRVYQPDLQKMKAWKAPKAQMIK